MGSLCLFLQQRVAGEPACLQAASLPACLQVCSKRAFEGQVKKWRRMLHTWDPPEQVRWGAWCHGVHAVPCPPCALVATASLHSHDDMASFAQVFGSSPGRSLGRADLDRRGPGWSPL